MLNAHILFFAVNADKILRKNCKCGKNTAEINNTENNNYYPLGTKLLITLADNIGSFQYFKWWAFDVRAFISCRYHFRLQIHFGALCRYPRAFNFAFVGNRQLSALVAPSTILPQIQSVSQIDMENMKYDVAL